MVSDYNRVAQAINYLDTNFQDQPNLAAIATKIGLSEFHFQRLFRRWAGISPKRFLQFLTAEYARDVLVKSRDLFDATCGAGLSGPGRLHDLFVNIYAATPAQVRDAGSDLEIRYGFAPTPFGQCLIAETDRGLCGLSFIEPDQPNAAFESFRSRWRSATLVQNDRRARTLTSKVFSKATRSPQEPVTVHLQGTNFQIRVWEALLRIPAGIAATYQDIASGIGAPEAVRAVGTAIGHNPIAYLIPCHRVLRKSGALGGYRWGVDRKRALLGWEGAKVEATVKSATNRN